MILKRSQSLYISSDVYPGLSHSSPNIGCRPTKNEGGSGDFILDFGPDRWWTFFPTTSSFVVISQFRDANTHF